MTNVQLKNYTFNSTIQLQLNLSMTTCQVSFSTCPNQILPREQVIIHLWQ